MSAYNLSHGLFRTIYNHPLPISDNMVNSLPMLKANRKLTGMLWSKSLHVGPFSAADLVEVFLNHEKDKHGRLTSPCIVLNHEGGTVNLLRSKRQSTKAFILDIRPEIADYSFAQMVFKANDILHADF